MNLQTTLAAARRLVGLRLAQTRRKRSETGRGEDLIDAPLDVLAAKVLYSHIRNKQQLLGPPPSALGHVDQHQAELLIHAAVAAASADGTPDEAAERKLRSALATLEAQAGSPGFVTQALKRPQPLEQLIGAIRDPHMASLFYAASLLVLDAHRDTNRAYLRYLALRLRLPANVLERLHNQYGVALTPDTSD